MINPVLLPLCGSLAIHWYGVMIALGLILFITLSQKKFDQKKLLTSEEYHTLLFYSILAGVLGGKLVHIISEWHEYQSWTEIFMFAQGGFSILGTVIAVAITVPVMLHKFQKPLLPVMDIVASYAPLIQAFGRIGCLIAGCCSGCPTTSVFSVMYTHPESLAPRFIPLCPTQLYSAAALLFIFCILWIISRTNPKAGTISVLYFILIGVERFVIDFWRDDRIFLKGDGVCSLFSFHQWLALAIVLCASALLILFTRNKQPRR